MQPIRSIRTLFVSVFLATTPWPAIADPGDSPSSSASTAIEQALATRAAGGIALGDVSRWAEPVRALYDTHAKSTTANGAMWSRDGALTASGLALLEQIRRADQFGLRSKDYPANVIIYRAFAITGTAAEPADWLALDVALSFTAARFLTHLHSGRIDPRTVGHDLDVPHAALDLTTVLAALANTTDVPAVLSDYEPAFRHYELLRRALFQYRQLAQQPELTALPQLPTRSVRSGERYDGMAALRKLLVAVGDLPGTPPDSSDDTLDPATSAALQRFQERHGLEPDGTLGRGTYTELTTPFIRRVQQIELAIERSRWLPPKLDSPPIVVNIPQFKLFAFRTVEDRESDMLHMNVVVGKIFPQNKTPVFAADLRYVVIRPYWDAPRSIIVNELLPSIRANPAWLVRNHFEIVQGDSDTSPVLAPSPESIAAVERGAARLRQRPGPDNSLGNFKFLFPNRYNVYLHDTPARGLFARAQRAASHGCVRVEDPRALANQLLANEPGWTDAAERSAKIDTALAKTMPTRVTLKRPVRVFLMYATALAIEDGRVLFFDDIYGHDAKLVQALGSAHN